MFSKKKEKKFNPYENRADEMLYKVWEERDRLLEKTRQAITRVGVINLYPDCADCACCPLSNECNRRSISYECADDLLEKLKE